MQMSQQSVSSKSSNDDVKGWWAYQVDRNDSNYNTRNYPHMDLVFYDSDQNWQIEKHYQLCVKRLQPFGKQQ